MSNTFLSASSIPGGLLPSPSANLFERSIGTLLSTFKYSVSDPINANPNNIRYPQNYQQAAPAQYQYTPAAPPVNNVNVVMGPTGPVANTNGMIPLSNNHKSVKKTTLYGEMMAVKLEKENKTGANLALPSTTTYTNINLTAAAPNVPSQTQTYTSENIKPGTVSVTASTTSNSTNTFQIPPPIPPPTVNGAPSQITLHSNYPPPAPQGQTAVAPPVLRITTQNNQQTATNYQNVTVQNPAVAVNGTFQNLTYQQPTNISIGSNYPQPSPPSQAQAPTQTVNKVSPTPPTNNGQTIYPSQLQISTIQPNVNVGTTNFQAPTPPQAPGQPQVNQTQRTAYAPITQLSSSVSNSNSSQQQMPNQKMEENTNLLSNHLQQNVAPTLNYIVGVFMDSIDSMQQNIDFFQSGTTGFAKNSDNSNSTNVQKINYHPNMLTLFNDGLVDDNTNKSYVVNYSNANATNTTNKDDSKLINEYFNWDELLSDTEKTTTQKTQLTGSTSEFQQPAQQAQSVSLFNSYVPSQTVNVQQGQPQTIQLQPQQITVNGQQNLQIQAPQLSISNPTQTQLQQQTITVPAQSQQNGQIQIQIPTPQLQQQSLPIQQINVQNPSITITPQQTPQLRTQTLQTSGTATGQPTQGTLQQQPMVVMVEPNGNYTSTLYQPQNTLNQNFVGQPVATANTFNPQAPSQTQFNTFTTSTAQAQASSQTTTINYTTNNLVNATTQKASTATLPSNTTEKPQTSQSLMFKGDTQDITRMTRVENTATNTTNTNNQFYQGFQDQNAIPNVQTTANGQFTGFANKNTTNTTQLQDGKLLNKSLDNLNSTSTSVTISNNNGAITDTANSNTTLDSVATNNTTTAPTTTKKRKERPSTKPKPFKCPTCQQTFSRSHDLKRHIYTHTGIKPFKCEKCGKSFSRRDALNRHSKGEINCIRYLNKLNNMKKQQNKQKQQQQQQQQQQQRLTPQQLLMLYQMTRQNQNQ